MSCKISYVCLHSMLQIRVTSNTGCHWKSPSALQEWVSRPAADALALSPSGVWCPQDKRTSLGRPAITQGGMFMMRDCGTSFSHRSVSFGQSWGSPRGDTEFEKATSVPAQCLTGSSLDPHEKSWPQKNNEQQTINPWGQGNRTDSSSQTANLISVCICVSVQTHALLGLYVTDLFAASQSTFPHHPCTFCINLLRVSGFSSWHESALGTAMSCFPVPPHLPHCSAVKCLFTNLFAWPILLKFQLFSLTCGM